MNFVIDERVKNRITGLIVIIAIAVIFLPALMKKSNHRFDKNFNVSLKLPEKPPMPQLAIPNQQKLFKTVKVAHVDIPSLPITPRVPQIAKAEPLYPTVKAAGPLPEKVIARSQPVAPVKTLAPIASKSARITKIEKNGYSVQLASFIQQENAKLLVSRLQKQGYAASYNKVINKQGQFYQVLVGKLAAKDAAVMLQKKLVTHMQLSGIIVRASVG